MDKMYQIVTKHKKYAVKEFNAAILLVRRLMMIDMSIEQVVSVKCPSRAKPSPRLCRGSLVVV